MKQYSTILFYNIFNIYVRFYNQVAEKNALDLGKYQPLIIYTYFIILELAMNGCDLIQMILMSSSCHLDSALNDE